MTTEFFPEHVTVNRVCRADDCKNEPTMPSGYCCKRCYHRQYRRDHKDELNRRHRERYATDEAYREGFHTRAKAYSGTDKGRVADARKKAKFYAKNPEYNALYAKEHSVKATARSRQWRLDHPDRYRELSRIHARARRKGIKSTQKELASIRDWQAILSEDPCVYCGDTMKEMDHIEPIVTGGPHVWDNLTSACKSCNASKGARPLLTYLRLS